jgi:hypothetical protein
MKLQRCDCLPIIINYLLSCGAAAQRGPWPPHSWGFYITFTGHTTLGRTPLDEWSSRRRDLYLTEHNTDNRHPFPRRDSYPQSQQASGLRPRGYWDPFLRYRAAETSFLPTFQFVNIFRLCNSPDYVIVAKRKGFRTYEIKDAKWVEHTLHIMKLELRTEFLWVSWKEVPRETWPRWENKVDVWKTVFEGVDWT